MSKIKKIFRLKSKKSLLIYIHGYKGDMDDLPFLKKLLLSHKKASYLSFNYNIKEDFLLSNFIIGDIKKRILSIINPIITKYYFENIYIIGYSLGAALAVELVADGLRCDKLILISVFDDRKSLLKRRQILIKDNENISPVLSVGKIKKTDIFFIHGIFDTSISQSRAMKVFMASSIKKSHFIIIKCGHYFKDKTSQNLLKDTLNRLI